MIDLDNQPCKTFKEKSSTKKEIHLLLNPVDGNSGKLVSHKNLLGYYKLLSFPSLPLCFIKSFEFYFK